MFRVTSHSTNLTEREERGEVERAWRCIGEPMGDRETGGLLETLRYLT